MHGGAVCDPVTLSAAFVVGMAGSVHCLAMCGGVSGALGMRARSAATPGRASMLSACYQAGRLASYTVAGAFVGQFNTTLQGLFNLDRVALIARVMAGVVLIAVGVGVLFRWRPLAGVERLGGRLWRHLAPLARAIPPGGIGGSLLLGMLWGWLPCGFVYSMLVFAALKGGALQAGAMMLSFGLGTAPAVFGAGVLSAQVGRVTLARGLNVVAGWLLLAFGVLTVAGPLYPMHH
jgi:sulfite exporter TauE/SafE